MEKERNYITLSLTPKAPGDYKEVEVEVEFATVFYSRYSEHFTQIIDPLPYGHEWSQIISGVRERNTEKIMAALHSYLRKAAGRIACVERYITLTQVCRGIDYAGGPSSEGRLRLVFFHPSDFLRLTPEDLDQEAWKRVPEEATALPI